MCSFFGAVSASTITRRNTDRRSGLLGSVVFPANRPPLRRRGIGVCFVRLRPVRPSASSCPQGRSPYLRVGVAARSFRLPDCGARTSASAAGCLRHSLRTRPAVQAVPRHEPFPAKQTARLPAFLHRSFSLCALGPQYKLFTNTGRSRIAPPLLLGGGQFASFSVSGRSRTETSRPLFSRSARWSGLRVHCAHAQRCSTMSSAVYMALRSDCGSALSCPAMS